MPVLPVASPRDHTHQRLYGRARGVVVGVVHALPLPRSPEQEGGAMAAIHDRAVADAETCARAGLVAASGENTVP